MEIGHVAILGKDLQRQSISKPCYPEFHNKSIIVKSNWVTWPSFAQFVCFLREVCLLFNFWTMKNIIVNFVIQKLKSKHIPLIYKLSNAKSCDPEFIIFVWNQKMRTLESGSIPSCNYWYVLVSYKEKLPFLSCFIVSMLNSFKYKFM